MNKERVLLFTVLFGWMAFLSYGPVVQAGKDALGQKAFVAKLDWGSVGPSGKPRIRYTRIILEDMRGPWSAYTETDPPAPVQRCGGDGFGNYLTSETGTATYSWLYFIGRDCDVPTTKYRVCADWTLTKQSGVTRSYGPACTPWREP